MGPFTQLGLFLGACGGVVFALWGWFSQKPLGWGLRALAVPVAGVGLLFGAVLGTMLGNGVDRLLMAGTMASFEPARTSELEKAACGGDVAGVRALLSRPLDAWTRHSLGAVFDCRTTFDEETFGLLARQLHAQYLAGDARIAGRKGRYVDYCDLLGRSITNREVDRLKALVAAGLPMNCEGGRSTLRLEEMFQRSGGTRRQGDVEATVATLEFLRKQGAPLAAFRSARNQTLLDRAIEYEDTRVIVELVRSGIDPGHIPGPPTMKEVPAVLRWVERKFQLCAGCDERLRLTADRIAEVDAVLREPTREEVMRPVGYLDGGALHFFEFLRSSDGGAAFFRYLKARGADVGIASSHKFGFLAQRSSLSPELLAELNQLTPDEVRRMAYPVVARTGEAGTPLLESARTWRNRELEDFLCQHGVEGC